MRDIAAERNEPSSTRLSDQVYSYIKEQLLDGVYAPDGLLPIDDITKTLGVSRQPAMGALKRLALEGLVSVVPQVGCRARRYSREDAIDFYRLFAEGEALLAELAAERAAPSEIISLKIVSAQIGQLRELEREPQELSRQYRLLNNRWHSELHNLARSPRVRAIVEVQRDLGDYYVATAQNAIFGERLSEAHKEHEEIIDCLIRRDGKRAATIMRAHVLAISERFDKFDARHFDQAS